MNRIQLLFFSLLTYGVLNAQFVNNGATVTIQSGATLRVETNFENQSGTINNEGTLEVMGNFTNAAGTGTTLSGSGTVKFIGTANSDINTNGDALNHVVMDKTTSNGKVTLTSNALVNGNLSFTGTGNNKIELGNYDLTLSSTSNVTATTDHPTNGYVVTGGTGRLVKAVNAATSPVTMQIGDAGNYAPLQVIMSGNAAGIVSARTSVASLTPKYNDADAYINREWIVSTPSITSTSLQGTYVGTDVTGVAANIKGCTFMGGGEWNFSGFAGAANSVTGTTTNTTDVIFSGQNFFGKYTSMALLEGPKNGSVMNNNLSLPLISPYLPNENVSSIPPNAVDWVSMEIRDPGNSATVISRKSGFILTNGNIVGLDGSSQLRNKVDNSTTGTGYLVIKHRNHLAIMTNLSKDLISNPTMNFINGSQAAFGTNAMRNDSGVYSMWAGDANSDGLINAVDRNTFWRVQNGTSGIYTNNADFNLDNSVNAIDRNSYWRVNNGKATNITY